MNFYIIHSESERGFWSNEDGWVSSIFGASLFTYDEISKFNLPISKGNDAKTMIACYHIDKTED